MRDPRPEELAPLHSALNAREVAQVDAQRALVDLRILCKVPPGAVLDEVAGHWVDRHGRRIVGADEQARP